MTQGNHADHGTSTFEPGLDFGPNGEPIPLPTPIARPHFDGAAEGVVRVQLCPRKGPFFYPRNRCPCCQADDWSWVEIAPDATVVTYTIDRIGMVPGLRSEAPYGIGIFELADGIRMAGRVRTRLDDLKVGAKARAVAVRRGPVHVFEFELV
jgi:uncharacterized OB-fold protein